MSYIEDLEREITATANVAERQRERAKAAEAQVADLRARLEASEHGLRALEDSEKHLDGVFNEERAKLDASERGASAMRSLLWRWAPVLCGHALDCMLKEGGRQACNCSVDPEERRLFDAALASDAGKDFVSRAALDVARAERDLLQHVACAAAFDCGRSAAETDRVEVSLTKWIRDSYVDAGWNEAIEAAAKWLEMRGETRGVFGVEDRVMADNLRRENLRPNHGALHKPDGKP